MNKSGNSHKNILNIQATANKHQSFITSSYSFFFFNYEKYILQGLAIAGGTVGCLSEWVFMRT